MKSILYIGATLMIGASIYGFVDYKKTNRNEAFKNMYAEKEVTEPVTVPEKEFVTEAKTVIPETEVEKEKTAKKKAINKEPVHTVAKNNRIKKQKKLDTELFSRAPLREYPAIKETPKAKKVRTEEIKSVN